MKRIGIVAHSAEGGGLCFLTVCREGQSLAGPHMHPEVVLSAIPMGLSMPGWRSEDRGAVREHLTRGVEQVAIAGADFFICPDNTAHIVLEQIAPTLPIPGMHIAEVVCREMIRHGWRRAGLLGTRWTMEGQVYPRLLADRGLAHVVPDASDREFIDTSIFDELCCGRFEADTVQEFIEVIDRLQTKGADCVILGCTEIPLIVNPENSPLPPLDSTRLLAREAVRYAVNADEVKGEAGWIRTD